MNVAQAPSQKDSDLKNPLSYSLTDFFDLILCHLSREGYGKREARAIAYDAVELRFNVTKSRARNIMYAVRSNGDSSRRMKSSFYLDNEELIKILQTVSEEFSRQRRV